MDKGNKAEIEGRSGQDKVEGDNKVDMMEGSGEDKEEDNMVHTMEGSG